MGGQKEERRAPQESRGKSSVGFEIGTQHLPMRRRTQDHRGGRRLLCPSTHTKAKYHQPHRLGGVQTCIWDAGSGNQKRKLVGRSRRIRSPPTDGRWGTDDGGDQTLEESRLNTQKRAERGHIGRKERRDGQDVTEGASRPDESRRKKKEGTTSSSTGNIET